MNPNFSLKCRKQGGGTAVMANWGADCEYGVLRDVLLGPADNYQWLKTSSVSKKSIRRNLEFDAAVCRNGVCLRIGWGHGAYARARPGTAVPDIRPGLVGDHTLRRDHNQYGQLVAARVKLPRHRNL
jgi:hypothetical protein